MTDEGQIRSLLAAEADRWSPTPDGFERIRARIRARIRTRRRRRMAGRWTAGLMAAGLVAGGVVTAAAHGHSNQSVTVVTQPKTPAPAGPGALISVGATQVQAIDPLTGRVLRRVELTRRIPGGSAGQIGVSPTGTIAYVSVSTRPCHDQILAVNTYTGAERVEAEDAMAPAVNSRGTELAYLSGSSAVTSSGACAPSSVVVADLTTGAHHSWKLAGPALDSGTIGLASLTWGARSDQLILGGSTLPRGIQILNLAKPSGATNPTTLVLDSGGHLYDTPIEEPGGALVAVDPACQGAIGCAAPSFAVVRFARLSGPSEELASFPDLIGLVSGPPGARVIVETSDVSGRVQKLSLYRLKGGGAIRIGAAIGPVAWARSAPDAATPAPHHSSDSITTRMVLDQTTVRSGGTIRGTIFVDNGTGKGIHVGGCLSVFEVVLTNRSHPAEPASASCAQTFTFPVGTSHESVEFSARSTVCGTNQPGVPVCGRAGPPSLPAGTYQATAYESGATLPVPAPVTVRVTP